MKRTQSAIFSKGLDHTFADLGRRHGKKFVYAESYLYAGEILAKHVCESNHDQDLLVYPIVLLFRHHLELEFKNIINAGTDLVEETRDLKTHNLLELWKWAKPIIRIVEPGLPDPKEFSEINKLVSDFASIDSGGDAFRFSHHIGGKPTLEGVEFINIRELATTIHRLGRFLGGCYDVVLQYVDFQNGLS